MQHDRSNPYICLAKKKLHVVSAPDSFGRCLVRKKHGTCTYTSNFDVGNVYMYVDVGTMLNTAAQPTP